MASLCHHCHPAAPAGACYCYCSNRNPCYHHPPPPLPDPHIHHLSSPPPYSSHTQPHFSTPPQHHPHFQQSYFHEEQQTHPTVSALLRRIAVLESSLRGRSSSSSLSLRDAAARNIQTHFRAFLVRRSRTLRQLKDLAAIKSTLNFLKSSVSEDTGFDYEAISQKAMNLLLNLDCIQGGDPMIRDGKRSINRELITFLDFIDGVCGRREISSRVVKNVRFRGNNNKSRALGSVNVEKLRGLVEKMDKLSAEYDVEEGKLIGNPRISVAEKHGISQNRSGGLLKHHGGIQTKPKKSASFAENGKVYKVLRRIPESFSNVDCDDTIDGDISVDLARGLKNYSHREVGVSSKDVEDDEEEAHLENGSSQCSSDGKER